VWRAHGLDGILRECWERGVVLCGLSAGSLCWFEQSVTAFHGAPSKVEGLGLLPYSNCVHYDGEPARREEYHRFLAEGMIPGYAAEDGAALHFIGDDLARVVSSRPKAKAYRVEDTGGEVSEIAIQPTYLGEAARLSLAAA
jgi:peptidase E